MEARTVVAPEDGVTSLHESGALPLSAQTRDFFAMLMMLRTIQETKNLHLRHGLVAGIKADAIRARLLELSDAEASLEKCIPLVSAIECQPLDDYSLRIDGKHLQVVRVGRLPQLMEVQRNQPIRQR